MADTSSTETLAKNLRHFMLTRGVTQARLAALSGLGQTTVSLYLDPGRRKHTASGKEPSPSLAKIQSLADALDVDLWELLRPLTAAQRDLLKSVEAVVAEHLPASSALADLKRAVRAQPAPSKTRLVGARVAALAKKKAPGG